ncbi:MAG: endolytic transglycosylase MltG [Candidatus Nanopelagicales bacterium]
MSQLGLGMAPDDAPARRRRSRGPLAVLIAVVALAVVALGAVLGLKSLTAGSTDFQGEGTGSVTVVVKKGDSLSQIGRTLAAAGVVADESAFVDAASGDPKAQGISPGTYVLRSGMSGTAAVALMLDPESRKVAKVVVPEGLRMEKTLAIASKATGIPLDDLKAAAAKSASLGLPEYADGNPEGFLFPATYEFEPSATADDVVKAMLTRFDQAATDLDLESAAAQRGLDPLDVVTIASILEVEVAPADYGKAARVLYNRLDKGMRLQLDSTVNYALGKSELKLSAADLAVDSPYNTYKVKGLPPGPIGSPGEAAIQAALNPDDGSWLYWVTTDVDSRTTEFATTYDQFLVLKKKFQANAG